MVQKICLIASTILLVVGLGFASRADSLILVSADWCPLVCESDKPGILAKQPGFVVEIAKTIFEAKGHRVVYGAPSWSRAIFETRKGNYTGILAALKNDAPDFIYPEEAVGINRMCFYVKSGNPWRYNGVSSLDAVILGVIQDYAYDNGAIDEYIKKSRATQNNKVQAVASKTGLEQNFNNIALDRITVILDECQVVAHYLKRKNLGRNYQRAGCLEAVKMYVGFSPALDQSHDYAALFSIGMKKLRRSGKLQTLLNKYGLKDWESK